MHLQLHQLAPVIGLHPGGGRRVRTVAELVDAVLLHGLVRAAAERGEGFDERGRNRHYIAAVNAPLAVVGDGLVRNQAVGGRDNLALDAGHSHVEQGGGDSDRPVDNRRLVALEHHGSRVAGHGGRRNRARNGINLLAARIRVHHHQRNRGGTHLARRVRSAQRERKRN